MLLLFTDGAKLPFFLQHGEKLKSLPVFRSDNPFHSHLGIVLCESEGV